MKKWEKKQRKDASDFKGRETPRSGGLWGFQGDVVNGKLMIESKHTEKKSFSVTDKLWRKTYEQALKASKIPVLSVQLGTGTEFVVLCIHDLIEILDKLENYDNNNQN
jgi:hypothetical protein